MDTRLTDRAIWLSWFTIIYNMVEGAVSIGFGVNDESIALAGFGMDSLIEVASALLILWRFKVEAHAGHGISIDRERKATLGIGGLFILLAAVICISSLAQLWSGLHPDTTLPGLIISAVSLSFMFWLWKAKLEVAEKLNSAAMMKDAACSFACIKLSIVLFAGSLLFLAVPTLWWADAAAAVVLAALIGKEGWETVEATRHPDFSGGCGCSSKGKC